MDAFRNTKWAGNGWRTALRMIEGAAAALPNAIRWRPGDRHTDRDTRLPIEVIREPMMLLERPEVAAAEAKGW